MENKKIKSKKSKPELEIVLEENQPTEVIHVSIEEYDLLTQELNSLNEQLEKSTSLVFEYGGKISGLEFDLEWNKNAVNVQKSAMLEYSNIKDSEVKSLEAKNKSLLYELDRILMIKLKLEEYVQISENKCINIGLELNHLKFYNKQLKYLIFILIAALIVVLCAK